MMKSEAEADESEAERNSISLECEQKAAGDCNNKQVTLANFQTAIQSECSPRRADESVLQPSTQQQQQPLESETTEENPITGLVQKNIEAISPTRCEREQPCECANNDVAPLEQPESPSRQAVSRSPPENQPDFRLANVIGGLREDLDDFDELMCAKSSKAAPSYDVWDPQQSSPLGAGDMCANALDLLEVSDHDESPAPWSYIDDHPEDKRSPIKTANCGMVNIEKIRIYIHYAGTTTVVSWPRDTDVDEVQKAVLCACDCIYSEGSAQLLELNPIADETYVKRLIECRQHEVGGCLVSIQEKSSENSSETPAKWYQRGQLLPFENFKQSLRHNTLYLLEPTVERSELKAITGDEYRRLLISVPALSHLEASKAVEALRKGTNLIKTTRMNDKHLRFFQLSTDLRRLLWYSGRKSAGDTTLNMSDISEIKINRFQSVLEPSEQRSTDEEYYLKFSFTIITKKGALRLCAKNEDEFDTWVTGLKALAAHFHDISINKVQLLGHSRRFREEVEAASKRSAATSSGEAAVAPRINPAETRALTNKDAVIWFNRVGEALTKLTERMKALEAERNLIALDMSATPDGQANMTDMELEHWQACKFIAESQIALRAIDADIKRSAELTYGDQCSMSEPKELMASIARRLWEIEVNIENINDIIWRLSDDSDWLNFGTTLTALQKSLDLGRDRIVQGWNHFTEQILKPTVQRLRSQDDQPAADMPEMVEPN